MKKKLNNTHKQNHLKYCLSLGKKKKHYDSNRLPQFAKSANSR